MARSATIRDTSRSRSARSDTAANARGRSAGRDPSRDDFREFDDVAPRVRDESKPATDRFEGEGFTNNGDAAAAQLGESLVDTFDVETEMMITGVSKALREIRIFPLRIRAPITEELDMEGIVIRRCQIGEVLV